MEWMPIARVKGKPEVREHPRDAALLVVEYSLTRNPPASWIEAFNYPPGHVVLGDGMQLSGNRVSVWAEESQLEDAVQKIDQRIELANRAYEREVLPSILAEKERRRQEQQAKTDRLEAARAKLKDL